MGEGEDVGVEEEKSFDNFVLNINAEKALCMDEEGSTSEPPKENIVSFPRLENHDGCAE